MKFKKIKEYPKYRIYEDGAIFSEYKNKFLSPTKCPKGYNHVYLTNIKTGKIKGIAVHRVTLIAWSGECPKGLCAAHLDGNNQNNHYKNLAWVTYKENSDHQYIHGTRIRGFRHPKAKLQREQAEYILKNYRRRTKTNKSNSTELALKFGVSTTTIRNLLRGYTFSTENLSRVIKPSLASKK